MFSPTILIAEDDGEFRRHLVALCRQVAREHGASFQVVEASDVGAARAALQAHRPDVAFLDFMMPDTDIGAPRDCGFELLRALREANPLAEAIMMSAVRTDAVVAVEALTAQGAFYFLVKDRRYQAATAQTVLLQAVHKVETAQRMARVRRAPGHYLVSAGPSPLDALVGSSPVMQEVRRLVETVAPQEIPVLLLGQTGTGKELVARALHYHSPRRDGPFVAVNCSAVPAELWESQFLGHARGAFTGAEANHEGFIAQAAGGTLFLDEVGDIPLSCQPKLLRALEEGQFRPVGSARSVEMDARIVSATKQPLREMVRQGRFRDDLYYRLEGFPIEVAPLASRGRDVVEIAAALVERHAARMNRRDIELHQDTGELLRSHPWPGNVRELGNVIERCVLMLADGELITRDVMLRYGNFAVDRDTHEIGGGDGAIQALLREWQRAPEGARRELLAAEIRTLLTDALAASRGRATAAARQLGLSRSGFYRHLETFGVARDR